MSMTGNKDNILQIPETFDVSVILQIPPGGMGGEVIGVVASGVDEALTMHSDAAGERVLCPGFRLRLHRDEAESYYMNLTGERPAIFVICRQEDDEALEPFLVTLSYDEASSYMEVEDAVFSVPMPPELYRWLEAFVLQNYVPEPRKKRKLDNWKEREKP